VAAEFKTEGKPAKIIIGRDTRISGPMLEHALVSGICSMGGDSFLTGIMPTPGVAYLARLNGACAGIVISASHNPYQDNGIKIFKSDGYKLSDEQEARIESLILEGDLAGQSGAVKAMGQVCIMDKAGRSYTDFLKNTLPGGMNFSGMKIVLDCSNGAASPIAPALFRDLGADTEALFVSGDGMNINHNCGSQHPQILAEKVVKTGADIGLAFDGDADRLIAVDENGRQVTGDQMLAVCAAYMKEKGTLTRHLAVSTVMSNIGLCIALKQMGIRHRMTDVGDRYVVQEMRTSGAVIGGEDSGHMIFLNHHTTGDGMLTALRLIEVMKARQKPLSELARIMDVYPQKLLNVEVASKPDIQTIPRIAEAIKTVESRLGDRGRVLVRYSGTQNLCRVMVEGPTDKETRQYCQQIVDVVRQEIGK
jgi:phosphoglucosamine mutase